jgi:hypothetical protein
LKKVLWLLLLQISKLKNVADLNNRLNSEKIGQVTFTKVIHKIRKILSSNKKFFVATESIKKCQNVVGILDIELQIKPQN